MIFPNFLAEFFFEKATIEILGGTEIEPGIQTHQITKLIDFDTKLKAQDAAFKYKNLGGYHESFDPTTEDLKYQLPITVNTATGAITLTAGANYKQITQVQFTGGKLQTTTSDTQLEEPQNWQQSFTEDKKFISKYPLDGFVELQNANKCFQLERNIF